MQTHSTHQQVLRATDEQLRRMSVAVRRLQRRGRPVVGEQLEGVEAHYRNAQGQAFTVHMDSRSAFDMLEVYQLLATALDDAQDPQKLSDELDALASLSHFAKKRVPLKLTMNALLSVHWLERHGHLPVDEHNGMTFAFSRPDPDTPGKRIAMIRHTLEPTRHHEAAFAEALGGIEQRDANPSHQGPGDENLDPRV